jgi:hypothetical protein
MTVEKSQCGLIKLREKNKQNPGNGLISKKMNHKGTKTQRDTKTLCGFVSLCLGGSKNSNKINLPQLFSLVII